MHHGGQFDVLIKNDPARYVTLLICVSVIQKKFISFFKVSSAEVDSVACTGLNDETRKIGNVPIFDHFN